MVNHNLVKVLTKLGFGFLESVYEKCLMIELRKEGMKKGVHRKIDRISCHVYPVILSKKGFAPFSYVIVHRIRENVD